MNPFDVKKKALGAVKGYGREGIGEMLKKSYGKPAVSISIESMKAEPGMGEAEDEMVEGEGGEIGAHAGSVARQKPDARGWKLRVRHDPC